jgi:hypothetical protein
MTAAAALHGEVRSGDSMCRAGLIGAGAAIALGSRG